MSSVSVGACEELDAGEELEPSADELACAAEEGCALVDDRELLAAVDVADDEELEPAVAALELPKVPPELLLLLAVSGVTGQPPNAANATTPNQLPGLITSPRHEPMRRSLAALPHLPLRALSRSPSVPNPLPLAGAVERW
jgi:hypothetical protein